MTPPFAGVIEEMAKDPEDGIEEDEAEEVTDPERPPCPRCGWHNTRLSHTTTLLDSLLRTFSLRAFRCRSCGKRFRTFQRSAKA